MATPVELPTNHSYDPYDQSFILTSPDGVTPFPAQLASLLVLQANATSQAIIYGVQIGMCGLLFAVMTIMAKADKRRSAVYILNSLALLFLLLRNILACAQLSGIFYNYYNWQLHWYPDVQMVRNAQKVSIVTEVSNLLIDVAIYSSLVLQVHIVCCTLSRLYQRLIIFISILVCLITTSIRLALVVINVKFMILGLRNVHVWQSLLVSKVASVLNITSVVSIALFSVIFVVKLAFAIHLRRKLNMKQFGPMQIIFIMGCQTLFIPLLFAIITYFVERGAQINSFVPTVVAVFLPLSGMWATATTTDRKSARSNEHRTLPVGVSEYSSTGKSYGSTTESGGTDKTDTLVDDDEREMISIHHNDTPMKNTAAAQRSLFAGMDLEEQKNHVLVDRTYSVRSD